MKLRQHIDQNHKGNIAEFCRAVGVSHTKALRWLKYDCTWQDGQVLRVIWSSDDAALYRKLKGE